jgi:hypothetical protein
LFAQNKIMFKIFFSLLILSFFFSQSFAQSDSLVFNGTLSVQKSATYKYKIVVGEKAGKWAGYSILDAMGPNETKSTVVIQFLKEKEAFAFAEKTLISSRSKEQSFCFVGGLLKMNGKGTQVKGFFLGQDEKKKMCGSGSVKFDIPERARQLMTPDGTRDTNVSAIVTSKNSEEYEVKNGLIKLEVWDGGLNDNDSLTILVNDKIMVPPFQILNEKKIFEISLNKGVNVVKIRALNEGTKPPNSARFMIIDQNVRYPVVSFLQKNEEATIKIKW